MRKRERYKTKKEEENKIENRSGYKWKEWIELESNEKIWKKNKTNQAIFLILERKT